MSCGAEALLSSNERRRQGAGLLIISEITPGMPSAPMSAPRQRDADNSEVMNRVRSAQFASAEGKVQLSNISPDNKKIQHLRY